jgi:hypothetical protein
MFDATDFVRSSVDVLARFAELDWQLQKPELSRNARWLRRKSDSDPARLVKGIASATM